MAAGATSILLALTGSAAAHAASATVTVTGDDGNPVAMAAGAAVPLRNMAPTVGIGYADKAGMFTASVVGPDGVAVATPLNCYYNDNYTRYIDYRGNGNYTITINNYAKGDTNCASPTSSQTFVFAINGSTAITAPTTPFLRRSPNTYTTNTLSLPVALNPGATGYDVQYAAGAVLAPDGSISGPSSVGFVNSTTGALDLTFSAPGTYTVVARPKNGVYAGPWSPPVTVKVLTPFDLSSVSFPDPIGPKYSMKGYLNDTQVRGKVTIAMARRGSKNRYGKYRSIGSVHINSKGTFTKSFVQRKTGYYRVRISYAGSSLSPKTTIYGRVHITRRVSYK